MAKKTAKNPESTSTSPGSNTTPPTAPKRRAPSRKTQAPPAIDVATVGGVEPLANASDSRGGQASKTASSTNGGHQPSHDEIAQAAYFRHLNRGGSSGDEFEDWVEAERELRERKR